MATNPWTSKQVSGSRPGVKQTEFSWATDIDPMTWSNEGYDPYAPAKEAGGTHPILGTSLELIAEQSGYKRGDYSQANLTAVQDAWSSALGESSAFNRDVGLATRAAAVWQDYSDIFRNFYNRQSAAGQAQAETAKNQRKAFDASRKIATEGNEEGDAKPTKKATVMTGSNVAVRRAKRTSTSTPAASARQTVRVRAPGINI